jgi:hypothetical protein
MKTDTLSVHVNISELGRDQAMRQAVESYGQARAYQISLWLGNARPELKGKAFEREAARIEEQVRQAQQLIFAIANCGRPAARAPRPATREEVRA